MIILLWVRSKETDLGMHVIRSVASHKKKLASFWKCVLSFLPKVCFLELE